MSIYVRKENGALSPLRIPALKGKDGITPNIKIGKVTTLEAREKATVTREGTNEEPIFNFGIPKGIDGSGGSSDYGASIDDSTISTNKTWSSSKIEDFTLNNVGVIWEEINGGQTVINSLMEGHLREVEILGNSIQNKEDLSDIQHLGELLVDDEGEPILNIQGKQYKIDIKINNGILDVPWNKEKAKENYILHDGSEVAFAGYFLTDYLEVEENTKYAINSNGASYTRFGYYDENKTLISTVYVGDKLAKVTPPKTKYMRVCFNKYLFDTLIIQGNVDKFDDNLAHSYSKTILLPCQLMKVGDISDRLYWDSKRNRYIIEKRVTSFLYSDYQRAWMNFSINDSEICIASNGGGLNDILEHKIVCNNKKMFTFECLPKSNTSVHVYLYFSKEMLEQKGYEFSYDGARKYLIDSDSTIYGELLNYQKIDTSMTEQLRLPTYINGTYITINGGISGHIKAKAPVEGSTIINNLMQSNYALQQENKEIKATNDKQDELINTTMLATDEMFMMLEPLLAEAISLNERSVSKMVDMYVAMVQRGIKTIDQVPARYREQVKEVLAQLDN